MTALKIAAALILSPLLIALSGLVLTVLWGWYIMPVFHVRAIRIPEALGIALIMHMLTDHNSKQAEDDAATAWAKAIIGPLVILFFGWLFRLFL